jgi:hypothetical protein
VRAGLKYEIRLQSQNYDPDIFYVFPAAAACTVDAIQAACASNGVSGIAPTTPNVGGVIAFAPREPGDYVVAVDADWSGPGGPFTLTIFEYCGASSPSDCKPELCAPSLVGTCNQNLLTICADGTGYVVKDCAEDGLTCFNGACRPTVVDTVGEAGRVAVPTTVGAAGASIFNFYSVHTTRTLTGITQLRFQGSAIPLTWVVFESASQEGPYGIIMSRTTTSNGVSSGAAESSGPISCPLVAGRFYAIGMELPAGAVYDVAQEASSSVLPEATSFGQLLSAKVIEGGPPWPTITFSAPSRFVFLQRLTTTL